MVEIISLGSLPGERQHTTECRHCGTKFRFKQSEARSSLDKRDGNVLIIDCPLCLTAAWVTP